MKNLTKKHKILIGLLVLALSYLCYQYIEFRKNLFAVYDVPAKYTYKTSPTADLIVVDFNKYSCVHCQTLHPVIMEAIKKDGNIIYIPRPVSFQDEWSSTMTAAVYAAGEQGKFIEMFNGIYDNWPVEDLPQLFKVAGKVGIDTERLGRDMTNPDVVAWLNYNDQYFREWGLSSIPVLLVGKKQMLQYGEQPPSVVDLLDKFAEARASWL